MSGEQTAVRTAINLLNEALILHFRRHPRRTLGDLCLELNLDGRYIAGRDVVRGALMSLRTEGEDYQMGHE